MCAFYFVLEYMVEIMDQLKSRFRQASIVWTEPHQNTARMLVDSIHELHLLAALSHVGLIDANLVNPEPTLFVWES